jgi:hypothetical protein
MRWEIAGLQSRGFFSGNPAYKLGVVIASDPVSERVYQSVTLPALQAAGVSNPDTFRVRHDTLDNTINDSKQAVIHFQADMVTNVIFQQGGVDGGGVYALFFMTDAESQHYNPRYGMNSDDSFQGSTGNVPQDQFQNALGVGISSSNDADEAHSHPWPYTKDEKTCASIEAAAGFTFANRANAYITLWRCDALFGLQEGAQPLTGSALNAQLWADQEMKLGFNIFNAGLYTRYVGPGHWDGAGGYRLLHAVLNCNGNNACFVYDNENIYR